MKKLLPSFALYALILALSGCIKVDRDPRTEYVYVNESSSEIAVHFFRKSDTGEVSDDYKFTIPLKGRHSLIVDGWHRLDDALVDYYDHVTVSNGEKTVTQKYADGDSLFLLDSYVLVSEEKLERTLQYVFTDEFFEKGEPII